MNRPPVNALSPEFIAAISHATQDASRDGARGIVLSGLPGRFSAGLDLPLLLTLDRVAINQMWRELYLLFRTLAGSPIPIAAAITGHAPAGGTVLPLFCDYRIMAAGDWKLGLSEVQVGLPLPPIIFGALWHVVGARQAERLAVGGLLISADEAARVGLVDEIAPPDEVVSRAIAWTHEMIALPGKAMSYTRQKARADMTALFATDMSAELTEIADAWWTDEVQAMLHQAVEKLKGKRSPARG
jgi:enoyl-CoA hydratase/carnithine racemase